MSTLTLEVPDELADRVRRNEARLPAILDGGLRQLEEDRSNGFNFGGEVLEFFSKLPSPDEVLALRPSSAYQKRIDTLLSKSKEVGLTPEEEEEWLRYERVEHLVRMAKIRAWSKSHKK